MERKLIIAHGSMDALNNMCSSVCINSTLVANLSTSAELREMFTFLFSFYEHILNKLLHGITGIIIPALSIHFFHKKPNSILRVYTF